MARPSIRPLPRQPSSLQKAEPQPSAQVTAIDVEPAEVELAGHDSRQQLLVSGALATGQRRDMAREARYEVADPKVATVGKAC